MSNALATSRRVKAIGILVLLLGVWGALVPFVGPTFGYDMGGTPAWTWTESHATLHLAPGIAAVLGGAWMAGSNRVSTSRLGALLAAVAGTWFVIAPSLHPLWAGQSMGGSMSMGESALSSALTSLGYHYGTGVVIAMLGAYAFGVSPRSRAVSDEVTVAARHDEAEGSSADERPLAESRR